MKPTLTKRGNGRMRRHIVVFVSLLTSVSSFSPTTVPTSLYVSPSSSLLGHHHHGGVRRRTSLPTHRYPPSPKTATSLHMSAAPSLGRILSSMHGDTSFILSTLLLISGCGIAMEQKTTFGKALSAPLVTMLISLCLANVGVMPFTSPACKF